MHSYLKNINKLKNSEYGKMKSKSLIRLMKNREQGIKTIDFLKWNSDEFMPKNHVVPSTFIFFISSDEENGIKKDKMKIGYVLYRKDSSFYFLDLLKIDKDVDLVIDSLIDLDDKFYEKDYLDYLKNGYPVISKKTNALLSDFSNIKKIEEMLKNKFKVKDEAFSWNSEKTMKKYSLIELWEYEMLSFLK